MAGASRKVSWLVLLAACLFFIACSQPAAAPVSPLMLQIDGNGLHRVTADDLRPFGWDLASMNAESVAARISLSRGEQRLPFLFTESKGQRAILFYGQVTPTRYADYTLYTLSLDAGVSPALTARAARPTGPGLGQAEQQVHVEENTTYLAQVRAGDPWLGARLFAPAETTLLLPTGKPAAGAATLVVQVWAATQAAENPDHHLTFLLNGISIGAEQWDGDGAHTVSLRVDGALLLPEANELRIHAPGDTGARADLVYVDWAELRYQASLEVNNGQASFSAAGNAGAYTVTGLSAEAGEDIEIWDVTNAAQPVRLTGAVVAPAADSQSAAVTFAVEPATSGLRQIILATAGGFLKPSRLLAAPAPIPIPMAGADYIVIGHPSLMAAVAPLVEFHAGQGLRTAVASTDQIYHRFTGGLPDPAAITAFLRWAVADWPAPAPRFVLLAGDASYDPLGHLPDSTRATAAGDLVPTGLVATQVMGETASDNALADLDGDGLPDLAIGRLPAQTPAEMQAMVAKTLAYAQAAPAGDWQRAALFVADNDDPFFRTFGEQMSSLLPPDRQTDQLVIQPDQNTRSALLAALNEGRGLVSYMGHGALDIWAQEEILKSNDIAGLDQQGRLPVVTVWACLSGYFHHPSITSLGETLLLSPTNGAAAALVPTGETFPYDQQVMAEALFGETLFSQPTLGEALLAAFHHLDPANPGQRDIIHTFVLLGDPALKIVGR